MAGFSCNYKGDPALGALNDLYLDSSGNLATISGVEEIEETCYHVLQLVTGDYDFNTQDGIPYDKLLTSTMPIGNSLRLFISEALIAVNGVKSIDQITMRITSGRALAILVVVNLTNSPKTLTINYLRDL